MYGSPKPTIGCSRTPSRPGHPEQRDRERGKTFPGPNWPQRERAKEKQFLFGLFSKDERNFMGMARKLEKEGER